MRTFLLLLLALGVSLLAGCSPAPAAEEAPTAAPEPIATATRIHTIGQVRFSTQTVAGPEYRYAQVGRLDSQANVNITGRNHSGTWLLVEANGVESWVAHWTLEYGADSSQLPVIEPSEPVPREMRRETMPGSRPPLAFGYGLQAHMIGTNIEEVMKATRELGFNWLKQQVRWSITEPEDGIHHWNELDLIVDRATYSDIDLLFSVVTSPYWAREDNFDANTDGPPADSAHLAEFLRDLAGRYCGTSLRAIEVWNEQNLYYEWGNLPLSAEDYVAMLAQASDSIRNACPSMYIVSGAMTPSGSVPNIAVDDFVYLEQMLIGGLAQHVDAIGAHPSGYNVPASSVWEDACAAIVQNGNSFNGACDNPHHSWSFRSTMEGYRSITQKFGVNLPIWPTEFGWAAGGAFDPNYGYANDNSFEEQAIWTSEAFQMMKEWGWVAPPILWNLNFRVIADKTERAQWGIVTNDWTPLPVYDALKNLEK